MNRQALDDIRSLPDDKVVASLDSLAEASRRTTAAIVAHLVVVKERSIHLDLAYSSLMEYCMERLSCSKDMAYKRSAEAKVAGLHPEVLSWLEEGEMTLSGLVALAPPRDDAELVAKARGLSRRRIQEQVVANYPDHSPRGETRRRPVAEGLSKLELTVKNDVLAMLDEALDLDRHVNPQRDVAALLSRALGEYIEVRKKQRHAVRGRPRPSATAASSAVPDSVRKAVGTPKHPRAGAAETATVPARQRHEVYLKSGQRCEYVALDGRRCQCRAFLEYDHIEPRALGGSHDQGRMLCRVHNQRAAQLAFGEAHMERARKRARLRKDAVSALHNLGTPVDVARSAVTAAVGVLGDDAELACVLKKALAIAHPPPAISPLVSQPPVC